ncbi:MAG: beta-hydroxyacyl-ACP dehydratase [Planctomycetes bacterium]|nr:beta-hydroxyacyl-ACP dehydratase [Planctomycetota bacterium]
MRFRQLDRIVELSAGRSICAQKRLMGTEDYLRDHFPKFPVMPGVLMLEALFQASMWLVLATDEFTKPAVMLKEARNVKFADFVEPGEVLMVTAHLQRRDGDLATLKVQGAVGDSTAVSGRMVIESYQVADRYPDRIDVDGFLRREMRRLLNGLQMAPAPC